jgi:hypothetical protein
LATSLNNKSVFLSNLGQQREALAAIDEAVTIRRALAGAQRGAFLADLATSEPPRRVRRLDLLGECPAWDEQRRTTRVS